MERMLFLDSKCGPSEARVRYVAESSSASGKIEWCESMAVLYRGRMGMPGKLATTSDRSCVATSTKRRPSWKWKQGSNFRAACTSET